MIFVLSLTRGSRSQTLYMDAKIRAFFAAPIRRGEVTGRNSATGSQRRSIRITPPSAVSRTSFEVLCAARGQRLFANAASQHLMIVSGKPKRVEGSPLHPQSRQAEPGLRARHIIGHWTI